MGSCIICRADVDGWVCSSHEEDVCFEFTGTAPDQLTPGRYYRGTVDGFADFGVFIDVGDQVTGLLHTSELDRRLESLDWDPGEEVFVQVKNVRENGNVDLGWSIRQRAAEFRGRIIDDPEGDRLPDDEAVAAEPAPSPEPAAEASPAEPAAARSTTGGEEAATATTTEPEPGGGAAAETQLQRAEIGALSEHVGAPVRLEGELTDVRQTSGPTVFELHDETGTVECAAFESAGVRAYPEATIGDVVRIDGEVEERRGDLQVETAALEVLEGEERQRVVDRIEAAIADRATPDAVELLAADPAVAAVEAAIVEAATAIRRAVFESRPIVIRHNATVDGYLAGAALERAILPLVREEHEEADAEYHYVDRRPLDGRVYGMDDAMRDTTEMLDAQERHDEKVPLFVLVNAGSTEESRGGLALIGTYDARRVVVDGDYPDASMADAAEAFVSPHLDGDGEGAPTTVFAANLAGVVNPAARAELDHLPAVSYHRTPPDRYAEMAADAGYDADRVRTLREAIALKAFYQSYGDKRELIADLLFGDRDLAEHASEQFRDRVAEEVRTAEPHLDRREVDGKTLGVLDLDAFTHQYDFPPATILLGELADRAGVDAVVGLTEDALYVWSPGVVDMRTVGEQTSEAVTDGGVETVGGRDGHLRFLVGRREAVRTAAVDAIAEQL